MIPCTRYKNEKRFQIIALKYSTLGISHEVEKLERIMRGSTKSNRIKIYSKLDRVVMRVESLKFADVP